MKYRQEDVDVRSVCEVVVVVVGGIVVRVVAGVFVYATAVGADSGLSRKRQANVPCLVFEWFEIRLTVLCSIALVSTWRLC